MKDRANHAPTNEELLESYRAYVAELHAANEALRQVVRSLCQALLAQQTLETNTTNERSEEE